MTNIRINSTLQVWGQKQNYTNLSKFGKWWEFLRLKAEGSLYNIFFLWQSCVICDTVEQF